MNVVYKYQLKLLEKQILIMPEKAMIIRIDAVDGLPWLWAIVDTESPTIEYVIESYKTGQEIKTSLKNLRYLGNYKLIVGQEICLYIFQNNSL